MYKNFFTSRQPIFEVLLMLCLIIAALGWYGLIDKPIALSEELRQAKVKELFEKQLPEVDSATIPKSWLFSGLDTLLMAHQNAATQDSSSHYILLTGDSMTEELRHAVEEYAKKNGHKLKTCIWYSSSTKLWSETDRLAVLIKEYKPSFILFTLGSNELFIRDIDAREPFIKDIIFEADTAKVPFVWIAPPNWKEDTGINRLIEKNVGSGRYFRSSFLKLDRKKDGAHPTRAGAAVWTDSICTWLRTESAYKKAILMEDPKTTEGENRPYIAKSDSIYAPGRDGLSTRILLPTDKPLYGTQPQPEPAVVVTKPVVTIPPKVTTTQPSTTTTTQPVITKPVVTATVASKTDSTKTTTVPKVDSTKATKAPVTEPKTDSSQ